MSDISPYELVKIQAGMTDNQKLLFAAQFNSRRKDREVVLALSIFLGWCGVDRFYLGDVVFGVLKLATIGGCGVLWLIDIFLITPRISGPQPLI